MVVDVSVELEGEEDVQLQKLLPCQAVQRFVPDINALAGKVCFPSFKFKK